MNDVTPKGWVEGTHRAVPPEITWTRVRPLLSAAGVTRMADLTGLDRPGIPVWAAVRPAGRILQTTNGKGLREIDARVSAAMEAVEHARLEAGPPSGAVVRGTAEAMRARHAAGRRWEVVAPARLPLARPGPFGAPSARISWVRGERLGSGGRLGCDQPGNGERSGPAWIPANAVWPDVLPRHFDVSTNGLAAGNTRTEATLHGLYEVVERDVVTRSIRRGLSLRPPWAERVRERSVTDDAVAPLLDRLRDAGLRSSLVLLRHPARIPVFWCAILDPRPFHPCTRVTFGYGAHLSPAVAAVRAVTEAAQARLAYISGMREDLARKIEQATESRVAPVFRYFDGLEPTLAWEDVEDRSTDALDRDLSHVLGAVRRPVWRVTLPAPARAPSAPDRGPSVVKVLVEGTVVDRRWF